MRETERLHPYNRRRFYAELLLAAIVMTPIAAYAIYQRSRPAQRSQPASSTIFHEKEAATPATFSDKAPKPEWGREKEAAQREREAKEMLQDGFSDLPRLEIRPGMQMRRKLDDRAYR